MGGWETDAMTLLQTITVPFELQIGKPVSNGSPGLVDILALLR